MFLRSLFMFLRFYGRPHVSGARAKDSKICRNPKNRWFLVLCATIYSNIRKYVMNIIFLMSNRCSLQISIFRSHSTGGCHVCEISARSQIVAIKSSRDLTYMTRFHIHGAPSIRPQYYMIWILQLEGYIYWKLIKICS